MKDAYQFTKVKQVEPVERDVCFALPILPRECFNWYAVGTDITMSPQWTSHS